MASLKYVEGDLFKIAPKLASPKTPVVIPHVVNFAGKWGKGFVLSVSKFCEDAETAYREHYRRGRLILGTNQFINVESDGEPLGIHIVNMCAQTFGGKRPLMYNALSTCMSDIANTFSMYNVASIHAPAFGAGLAGGDWRVIEALIEDCWLRFGDGYDVTIYYLPGQDPRRRVS